MTLVTASGYEGVSVYTDDGNVALTGGTPFAGIHSRSMFFQDQAGGTTALGIWGQLKYASAVDIGQGRTAAVEGYNEFMTTNLVKSLGLVAALSSQTEITAGTLTVESGGILAGLHIRITGAGEVIQSSTGILAGIKIDETVTTGNWGYGIYIADGAATTGIYLGTSATYGLHIVSTHDGSGENGIYVNNTFTLGTGGVHKAIQGDVTYNGGYATSIGVAGRVTLDGTMTGSAAYCWGVQGQMNFGDDAELNDAGSVWAGGRFVLTEDNKDGVVHTDGHLCVVLIDSLLQTSITLSTGQKSLLRIGNWGGSSNFCTFDSVFHVYGRHCDNLFYFFDCDDVDGFITTVTGTALSGSLRKAAVTIDGATYYILLGSATA